jgi:hypothetical protein
MNVDILIAADPQPHPDGGWIIGKERTDCGEDPIGDACDFCGCREQWSDDGQECTRAVYVSDSYTACSACLNRAAKKRD